MGWQESIPALSICSVILCPAVVIFFGLPLQSYPELQVSLKFPPTAKRPDVPPRTTGAGTRWIPPIDVNSSDYPINTPSERGNGGTPEPSCTQQSEIPLTVLNAHQ